MKLVRPLSLALALFTLGAPSWAAQHDQHKAHHPAGSASAAASKSMPGKTTPEMARMANQMKAMQEMHDKMMAIRAISGVVFPGMDFEAAAEAEPAG